jgi:16S rRNA C1402 N4-methylase RsmH
MTTNQEYQYLQAELFTLKKMLKKNPELNIIERLSLEARMHHVEEELASYEGSCNVPAQL